jgi:transcriptional regulator with XRE-family HTH domain
MGGFGKKLRELRLKKDMSLRDLGELSGLSYSFIGSLEKERFKPSRETVYSLAKALNHPADELLLLAGFAPETPPSETKDVPSETKDELTSIMYHKWDKLDERRRKQALKLIEILEQEADEENNKK